MARQVSDIVRMLYVFSSPSCGPGSFSVKDSERTLAEKKAKSTHNCFKPHFYASDPNTDIDM
jgi:hypothetical protein